MSVYDGPKIITNGLVLALDAGNSFSYPGSGTTWNDISNNGNNGTLTNGPTFSSGNGGSIVFDGVNDYVGLSGSGYNIGVYFTIQTWVKIGSFGGQISGSSNWNRASIVTNSYPYLANQGFWITGTSQSGSSALATPGYERFFISFGNDQYFCVSQTGSLSNYVNSWVNLAVRVNSSALIKLYINGIETSYAYQGPGPLSINYTNGPFALAKRNNTEEYLSGSIANFTMYNRALSDQEIYQNYNATKTRFGL